MGSMEPTITCVNLRVHKHAGSRCFDMGPCWTGKHRSVHVAVETSTTEGLVCMLVS